MTRAKNEVPKRAVGPVFAAAAGAMAAAAFPPVDLPVLGVAGAATGLWLIARTTSARSALLHGLAYAVTHFALLYAWSLRFGVVAYFALTIGQAIFWLPVALVASRARTQRPGTWVMSVAATWVLVEGVRSRVPLGGFEWGALGVTAHGIPFGSAATIVGTLGLTGLLAACAAAIAVTADRRAGTVGRRSAPLAVTITVAAALGIAGQATWTQPTGTMTVGIVQADPVCPGRYSVDCPGEREELLDRLGTATAALGDDIDLVVWGEGTLRGPTPEAAGVEMVGALARVPAPLIAGVTSPVSAHRFFNRNVLYGTDGTVLGSYAKRQPVPFGEYVPARDMLGGIADVGRLVPRDMVRGDAPRWLPLDGAVLATVSSWEVTFSRLVRDAGQQGDALVVVTTQATYEAAAVSDQLLRAAQMRALESQRPIIVAATTGRSAFIDAEGRLDGVTRLYQADTLVRDITLRTGSTPFMRWGDTPIVVLAAAAVIGLIANSVRTRPLFRSRRPRGPHVAHACRT
jgi:apolipoprotein N-acyltransferase